MLFMIKRLRMTRFERAYIRLYNGEIGAEQFAEAAGMPDKGKAWRQLCEYRRQVIAGDIPDPRDKYKLWKG